MFQKLVVIFSIVLFFSCKSKKDGITPKRTTLVESVYASALVQPDSLYEVYSAVAGILDRQLVNEGDTVIKGQQLFQIFNKMPDLNRENAKLSLQQAKEDYSGNAAVLAGLQKELQTAQLKFQNDSVNFMRQQRLWEQKIGSQAEFEVKKLNYEASANTLEQLNNRYLRTQNDLQSRVRQADNNYQSAIINTKDFMLTSKINGRVYAIYRNEGEIITTQQPLASMGSSNVFIVDLLIDEVDIVKIEKGQKVLITLDAYSDALFEGKVVKIYPKKDERTQTFKVEAVFESAPQVLYPGLAGEANIVISEKENTLTIPLEYLTENNQVKTDDGLKDVTTGKRNIEEVEIISGIDAVTKIYRPE
ncbi:HlyD family efflux transporter periplasmic adaptor subunit [uncultured Kriegella sp.]|uniref:efflux RND transporter periplasmic adaptor subunit n=1 Tax=uncultured Kriegella sp. TaxID=1798910 RepID=UPI0030DA1352|tara:strand:- start:35917 stop:36999 length:1083 start_codon:yes stop_codon:yes gene_type:complete